MALGLHVLDGVKKHRQGPGVVWPVLPTHEPAWDPLGGGFCYSTRVTASLSVESQVTRALQQAAPIHQLIAD